jgi:hypothetical protein
MFAALSLSLIYSGSGLEFDLLLRARGFLGPSVDLGPSPEMDYVMVQRQDKVFKCHANNSPVSGRQTTQPFLQIFSAQLSGTTSVLARTIFFDLGKSSRSLPFTGLLNLRLGSRPPSSSALYHRWSHAFACFVGVLATLNLF